MWVSLLMNPTENAMTFQILLVSALEEGPVRSHTVRLPNAYETLACARAVACRMLDAGWCDWARVVVWGTNELPGHATPDSFVDDLPF
jgi:hypothetical protein